MPIEESVRDGVEKINRFMKSENKNMLDKIMETEQSIWGTHYRAILPDTVMPDECPFEILPLPADDTFVAYSSYDPNFPVYGCTMHPLTPETNGLMASQYVYKIYTNNLCYTYVSDGNCGVQATDLRWVTLESGKKAPAAPHILGRVPIIEYPNNEFRMGDWEMAIDLFDAINSMSSDCLNDVEQTVLSYLVLLGVDDPDEKKLQEMRKYRILTLHGNQGANQDAKFITAQLDGQSAELLRAYYENALRVVVGIPDRNSSGGGDTGKAIENKNGWREIDTVAKNKVMFAEASERNLLRIALQILSPKYVPNDLSVLDIDISIPRNKNDDILSKAQSGNEMYQMHIAKTDIVSYMDFTTDVEGVVKRWEKSEQQALNQQKANSGTPKVSDPKRTSEKNPPPEGDPNDPESYSQRKMLDKAANE